MSTPVIIQLIADYGIGDPAFAEVVQRLTYLDKDIRVYATSVPAFSTVATGLWIDQLATVNAFSGLIIYSNTAPRKILPGFSEQASFGHLVYTRLENGVIIIAVNSGYALSFIKSKIKTLHIVNVPNYGSQFRSRDYYPDAVVGVARGEEKYVGEEVPMTSIPEPPTNLIGFIDGYGNLKTTQRAGTSKFSVGQKISINVGNVTKGGIVADETYKVRDGDVSFAPGSTGGEDRFMEIWVRGGSAWEAFGKPKVETEFKVIQT